MKGVDKVSFFSLADGRKLKYIGNFVDNGSDSLMLLYISKLHANKEKVHRVVITKLLGF